MWVAFQEFIGCERCGYKGPARHYDQHHRDASKKSMQLTTERMSASPVEQVWAELEKTDQLCAFCHRDVHHEMRQQRKR
jgi:DNA-directed RNA polymerase subunit M/transcription elongation factor TFIIS